MIRPLARLRFKTSRPPLVAMRARNPNFLTRLVLLGWYVRFIEISSLAILPSRGFCHGLIQLNIETPPMRVNAQRPMRRLTSAAGCRREP